MRLPNFKITKVINGGDAAYHDVKVDVLTFKPELQELIYGEGVKILDFSTSIHIEQLDSLCHISQVIDDYTSLDRKKTFLAEEKLIER